MPNLYTSFISNISRNIFRNTFILIVTVLGLFVLATLVWYPYIPREGDAFGCWFPYIEHLKTGGLSSALLGADATGRYPGYPILILFIQTIFHTPFLDSLVIYRILIIILSFFSLLLFFRKLGVELFRGVLFSLMILLTPAVWINIGMNTQDSFKCCAIMLSLIAALNIFEDCEAQTFNVGHYVFVVMASILLSLSRAPEILPFYAFVVIYAILKPQVNIKRRLRFLALTILPSFLFVIGLHLYGRKIVQHWSISSHGTPPDIWTKLAFKYVQVLPVNPFEKIFEFIRLSAANYLNKTGYFLEDYIFSAGSIRMVDVGHFFPGIQSPSTFRYFLLYPSAVLLLGFFIFAFLKFKKQPVFLALLTGSATAAGFYTFGLNHYEPRYWLIVFILLISAVALQANKIRRPYAFTILAGLILIGELTLDTRSFLELKASDLSTRRQALIWQTDVQKICNGDGPDQIVIPWSYYVWSSYRYFINQSCPRIHVVEDSSALAKDHPKNSIEFDKNYFANAAILGLD